MGHCGTSHPVRSAFRVSANIVAVEYVSLHFLGALYGTIVSLVIRGWLLEVPRLGKGGKAKEAAKT